MQFGGLRLYLVRNRFGYLVGLTVHEGVVMFFDDTSLLGGDLFQRVAKNLGVVETDICNDTDFVRLIRYVRAVQQTAEPDLDDRVINFLPGKLPKCEGN